MKKIDALNWLARGNPRGCNVGIYMSISRGESHGFFGEEKKYSLDKNEKRG